MPVSDLIKKSSIKFISGLRENNLILITKKGNLRLTRKGKAARKLGLSRFLELTDSEKEQLGRENFEINSERLGLLMFLSALLLSFVCIIGYSL